MRYRMANLAPWGAVLSLVVSATLIAEERRITRDNDASALEAVSAVSDEGQQSGTCSDCLSDAACCGRGLHHGAILGKCGAGCCRHLDMPPHYAYFPCDHGYYYFHPYNVSHIALHKGIAMRWGIDARNPYSNEIFQKIYAQYDADHPRAKTPTAGPGQAR